MILTDAKGRPLEKPERANYPDAAAYSRALAEYNDRVRKAGSEGFDQGFRKAIKARGPKIAETPQREPDDDATRKAKVAEMMKKWAVKGR